MRVCVHTLERVGVCVNDGRGSFFAPSALQEMTAGNVLAGEVGKTLGRS